MLRKSTHAFRRRFVSPFAMAVVLAAGGVLGTAALEAPAAAQGETGDEESQANSKRFAEAYAPFTAAINNPAGDPAVAKPMIPSVRAAIENNADKWVFGQALIALGNKLNDREIQREGLTLSLETGRTTPEQTGLFHYFLARWASEDKNYAEARRHYQASYDAGYREGEPDVLIADTYFGEGKNAEGLDYLQAMIERRRAAGQTVPDSWILRGLQVAYNAKLAGPAQEFGELLLRSNPSEQSWNDVVAVVSALTPLDAHSRLDLLRLMREVGTLSDARQFSEYVEAAQLAGLPTEVLAVLDEGLAKGVYSSSDPTYAEAKSQAEPRAADDRREVPGLVDDARAAANGRVAYGAANAFYSMESWAEAEDMFKVALEKGVEDRELALTRLGMAQIQQQKFAEAEATLEQVTGPRAAIARMWVSYAMTKQAEGA